MRPDEKAAVGVVVEMVYRRFREEQKRRRIFRSRRERKLEVAHEVLHQLWMEANGEELARLLDRRFV